MGSIIYRTSPAISTLLPMLSYSSKLIYTDRIDLCYFKAAHEKVNPTESINKLTYIYALSNHLNLLIIATDKFIFSNLSQFKVVRQNAFPNDLPHRWIQEFEEKWFVKISIAVSSAVLYILNNHLCN